MIELHVIQEMGKRFGRKGDKFMDEAKVMLENLSAENSHKDVDVTETDLLKQEPDIFAELKASFDSLKV
jgi:hypothetical protein